MKMLLPPDKIRIPSGRPRTYRGIDSRGVRLCFAELGRSCSLDTGYLIFTDGSAYDYGPGSKDAIEALCTSPHRGKVFNFTVRRAVLGFVRGFTPPADYETIYTFPPYAGSAPTACPLPGIDWSTLDWSRVFYNPGDVTYAVTPLAGTSATMLVNASQPSGHSGSSANVMEGLLSYNGPLTHCKARLQISTADLTVQRGCECLGFQDGTQVFDINSPLAGNFDFTASFDIQDTGGAASSIQIFHEVGSSTSSAAASWDFLLTMSNA